MNLKKTAVATAVATLAIPAAAQADKPADAGSKGKAKQSQPKQVGFTVGGLYTSGLTLPLLEQRDEDQTVSGPLILQVTSANKHAREFLVFTKANKPSKERPKSRTITLTNDTVRFVGFDADDVLDATDRVKVIGKVTRTGKGKDKTAAGGTLDVRRVIVTDVEPETETEMQAPAA